MTVPGRDDHHAVRSPDSVHRGGAGIFQDIDPFDITRVEPRQAVPGGHLHGHSIHHIQRLSVAVDGAPAPDLDRMPPLGNRMTRTPALRPSSNSSTCAAGIPCRSAALTVETALAVTSSEGAPGGADAGGWAHPGNNSVVATSAARAAFPVPSIAALVAGVLPQASDGRFTRRDRVQRVPRCEGRPDGP